ncbi:MAG: acyl carrier protein [Clostridiales bacterium]|nr:acyl carrier protein [Clostridiales bacterium]
MSKDFKSMLAKQLNIDVAKVTDDSRIVEDLGADSLDVVELLMSLEDEMGIAVSDEEALNLKTVGDIQKLINEKKED